jgi:hypothetical protein
LRARFHSVWEPKLWSEKQSFYVKRRWPVLVSAFGGETIISS